MKIVFLTVFFLTLNFSVNQSADVPRIFDGIQAQLGQFPWFVQLKIIKKNTNCNCAANLISQMFIITAAHCFDPGDIIKVNMFFGTVVKHQGLQKNSIIWFIHPGYSKPESKDESNIAVIKLDDKIELSNYIKPIKLAPNWMEKGLLNRVCTVAGMGKRSDAESSEVLRYFNVKILDPSYCCNGYCQSQNIICGETTDRGEARNACPGDGGGGLAYYHEDEYYLVGVLSTTTESRYCETNKGKPLFAPISQHIDWINKVTNNLS